MKKYWIILLIISLSMVYYFLFKQPNKLHSKWLVEIEGTKVEGIVEQIDANQASTYYFVKGTKYTFGNAGGEMFNYVEIGDSLSKAKNSFEIHVFKQNGLDHKAFVIEH